MLYLNKFENLIKFYTLMLKQAMITLQEMAVFEKCICLSCDLTDLKNWLMLIPLLLLSFDGFLYVLP